VKVAAEAEIAALLIIRAPVVGDVVHPGARNDEREASRSAPVEGSLTKDAPPESAAKLCSRRRAVVGRVEVVGGAVQRDGVEGVFPHRFVSNEPGTLRRRGTEIASSLPITTPAHPRLPKPPPFLSYPPPPSKAAGPDAVRGGRRRRELVDEPDVEQLRRSHGRLEDGMLPEPTVATFPARGDGRARRQGG